MTAVRICMKFFEQHFTAYHLRHSPHRWFLALLLSPVHAAEQHYKKKYHLTFVHAKKLFFFDAFLVITIVALTGLTVGWLTYRPDVTDAVDLSIAAAGTKLASGDRVQYEVAYHNASDIVLEEAALSFRLPPGFIFEPPANEAGASFVTGAPHPIGTIEPGQKGTVTLAGYLYTTPDEDARLTAELSYRQAHRSVREMKYASLLAVARDSVIESEMTAPSVLLAGNRTPIAITLRNNGKAAIPAVEVPLAIHPSLTVIDATVHTGSIKDGRWILENVPPSTSSTLYAALAVSPGTTDAKLTARFTPIIRIRGAAIPQKARDSSFSVLRPAVTGDALWSGDVRTASPGKTHTLTIRFSNTGNVSLENAAVEIPVSPAVVAANELSRLNAGVYAADLFRVDERHAPELQSILPGESRTISLAVPIARIPQGGTDLSLTLTPRIRGTVREAQGQAYTATITAPPLAIGTALTLGGSLRYFTPEGDQLGRGPLPPEVGKTTKYWALLQIANTTSELENVVWRATLPPGVAWTGRKSLSHGQDIAYDPATRTLTWQTPALLPHERASVNLELALVPEERHRGTAPALLTNIRVSGQDAYINEQVSAATADLTTALPDDALGRELGTEVAL